jgi:hypothetical protein
MATAVLNVTVNDDSTFSASGSLAAIPPLVAVAIAKAGKATFSLSALLKLMTDLGTMAPTLIADVEGVFAGPSPVPVAPPVAKAEL